MKRFILYALIMFFLINLASAQNVKELNSTIDIKNNDEAEIELIFKFNDQTKETYFSIPYKIYDLKAEGGKCYVEEQIKNTLICKPSSPFIVGEIKIKANFKINGFATVKENKTFFSLDIPILHDTEKVNIVVKLPELMALVDDDLLPLSPSGADIGSDGRRIIMRWDFKDQFKGDIIPLRIYYENLNPTNFFQLIKFEWIIFFLFLIAVGVFLIYTKLSKKSTIVFSILNEPERIAVNIIQEKGQKDIDQRIIVNSSGFSKAKVSRILQSLEARGVISIVRTGRKNKVTLKKKFAEEKTEQ